MALARPRGRAARVPLARPARERDRVGRDRDGVPATSSRRARPSSSSRRSSRRGRRAATASRSTSSRSSASGSRRSGRRRSISPSTSGRGSTSGASPSVCTARPTPRLDAALAAQEEPLVADGRCRRRAPRPGCDPGVRTGRACSSTRTRRATQPSAARSRRSRAAIVADCAPWAPGGGRNPRFGEPLLLPSLLDGLEPETHEGLPAYAGRDALFEGRAVVRLRSRSGRPSG